MDANISRGILEVRVMGSPHELWKTTLAGTNIREYRRIGAVPDCYLENRMSSEGRLKSTPREGAAAPADVKIDPLSRVGINTVRCDAGSS